MDSLNKVIEELFQFKFEKFNNIVYILVAFLTPTLPMLFLFKKEAIKTYTLIGSLILVVTINLCIVFSLKIIFTLGKVWSTMNKFNYFCVLEIMLNNRKEKKINKINKKYCGRLLEKELKEIEEKYQLKLKKLAEKKTKVVNDLGNFSTKESEGDVYKKISAVNVGIGIFLICLKATSICFKLKVGLDGAMFSVSGAYMLIVIQFILIYLCKVILKLIYKLIKNKKVEVSV
ncbi:hypothetical protein [Clostridium perfringens]|uniref:hypothetical protein n=1 Tax=Clostridium perfringens TaxID=1502 RepID=UPI001CB45A37|nr:hypothetical protein [Clostridium perfringens]EJT5929271.1 hypothetical protein [Clostridium perfringens]EJT6484043.1 hypothetical protein [Clostridium perfringens]MDK0584178.1 hypothetical protein [Clostridium perfringens]HBI6967671.1 hypothetical protein [Clostridium perfringens]